MDTELQIFFALACAYCLFSGLLLGYWLFKPHFSDPDYEVKRQMRKRCLAMAEWCDTKGDWYYGIGESFRDRVEFYIKWKKRWLAFAEKFKEVK